jgi:lipoprotein-anchoring transpeptidase ErfK/SrfK
MKLAFLLCCLAVIAPVPSMTQSRLAASKQTQGKPAAGKPAVPTPAATQAAPNEVLATQVMLDRVGFSPGEIDGRPGRNMQRALAAFQRAHMLSPTGKLDDATRERLAERSGNQPPTLTYEVTEADVAGPFAAIPSDMMAQSKLETLAYRDPLEALAEKYHSSPALLKTLNPDATFSTAGERVQVPNVAVADPLAPAPGTRPAAVITVSKATNSLTVEDVEGNVMFHAPVTTGSSHDPLPIGEWKVTGVQRNPAFHYNPDLFWDANPKHSKARLAPGPNNPVGTIWIDITKEHYGIHGTPEPGRIGHVQSHGCVRLTNWDVQRVAQWARAGTRVVFKAR